MDCPIASLPPTFPVVLRCHGFPVELLQDIGALLRGDALTGLPVKRRAR